MRVLNWQLLVCTALNYHTDCHSQLHDTWQLLGSTIIHLDYACLLCRFGAFLPDVASFDASLMGISNAEATLTDPQQRLLMETTSEALLTATPGGSSSSTFVSGALGTYIGIASSDYGTLVKAFTAAGAFHATSNAISVAAGRLSYTFGLSGPAVSVDTACSASLVALHIAGSEINNNVSMQTGSTAALVGGVHVQATSTSTNYVWTAGMLSPEGRCKVLDASADGYVRGEACHMLLVASAGTEHRGANLAVILGSAINQDGRSSNLTAPNGPAQQEVLKSALAEAGITGSAMDMLSLHGTGR